MRCNSFKKNCLQLVAHYETLFYKNLQRLLHIFLLHIKPHSKPHYNPIYLILPTFKNVIITCLHLFLFLYPTSPTQCNGKSSHIKLRMYRGIQAIRPSTNIVIWEMNGRALNKHAVVVTVDRTWSYSRTRICKWQRPFAFAIAIAEIIRCNSLSNSRFLRKILNNKENAFFFSSIIFMNFRDRNLFLFLNRLNKWFKRTEKNDRFHK